MSLPNEPARVVPLRAHGGACSYWNMMPMCGPKSCTVNATTTPMIDFWEQDRRLPAGDSVGAPYLSRPARELTNKYSCSQADQHDCTFEDDVLLAHAQSIVHNHAATDGSQPLFLYWCALPDLAVPINSSRILITVDAQGHARIPWAKGSPKDNPGQVCLHRLDGTADVSRFNIPPR